MRPRTLPDLLHARADSPFLFFGDEEWSVGRLDRASDAAASALKAKGVRPGDRVPLRRPNGPDFVIDNFAILKAGAVAVPINPALTEAETEFILRDSASSADAAPACLAAVSEAPPSDAPANIIYTSGTTGFPKGAVITRANLLFGASSLAAALGMRPGERTLCFLPLFHAFAQVAGLLAPLWSGGGVVLMEKFNVKEFFELLARHRCSSFSAVPSVYGALLHLSAAGRSDLSSLRFCVSGGAPLPAEILSRFEARFGVPVLEGYGLSEATCACSVNPPPPGRRKAGSIGLPLPGIEMRLLDGEIAVRGPNVMAGYWNNPAATEEALRDGWLLTGDLGRQDDEGYFYVVGRKKEMIIRAGENIYPREIEEALHAHPAVAEAAVVGLPDRRYGEEVAAFIVRKDGASLEARELKDFLKGRLAGFKLPRRVQFVPSLPKTATGKIQKRRLLGLVDTGSSLLV